MKKYVQVFPTNFALRKTKKIISNFLLKFSIIKKFPDNRLYLILISRLSILASSTYKYNSFTPAGRESEWLVGMLSPHDLRAVWS
jgi:hypothetical protein